MKTYRVNVNRTYYTTIELNFPDDGRDHMSAIEDNLGGANELESGDIWDLIYEAELHQMNVDDEDWEIEEINNTRTGALSNDTGPRN